ncbi:MAG: CDP-glycerol glycerophosphotransferase family protein [Proteobacteria bacterium]|nr:CDP-glycerol glycerophosphotransferase family protein [Pseudomonadota bacterium]
MFKFFKHLKNVIAFNQLDRNNRRLVFYSEGKTYWVHLEGIINVLLKDYDIPVCYVSSGIDDPGLKIQHKNYQSFVIDSGWVRNWFFENIETDVMVMTMPDINQYQVKLSQHNVHYVYTQHSLVSLHMVYRKGAFDFYDSIFCAAPHHKVEIRALEKLYDLPKKDLYEHGYGRLDSIINNKQARLTRSAGKAHVLLAPSWGDYSILELLGDTVIVAILNNGYKLTLRPHPQTLKFAKQKVQAIIDKHQDNPLFDFESDVAGQNSLHDSDIMICDWSGAALDYAFGLNKPVVFIDVPRKINNEDYELLQIEPYEVSIRKKIGTVVPVSEIGNIATHIQTTLEKYKDKQIENDIFNLEKSAEKGAYYLNNILKKNSK